MRINSQNVWVSSAAALAQSLERESIVIQQDDRTLFEPSRDLLDVKLTVDSRIDRIHPA